MSDANLDDMEEGEAPEAGPKKKKGGLGALLPTLLKFAAIGIGALLFIVTVSVITYNIMNDGGKTQTNVTDPSSPYIGRKPIFAWYTDIGTITTRAQDNLSVSVVVNLGYDQTDTRLIPNSPAESLNCRILCASILPESPRMIFRTRKN